jgi:hypothetical protein
LGHYTRVSLGADYIEHILGKTTIRNADVDAATHLAGARVFQCASFLNFDVDRCSNTILTPATPLIASCIRCWNSASTQAH